MKVLCNYTASGPSFVRSGWGRVFQAMGHEFRFVDLEKEAAFDAFGSYEPQVYLGTTYELSRAVYKNIAARPEMKVALFASAWGPYVADIDLKKYPLVVVGDEEKRTIERLRKETGKPDVVFIHAHGPWLEGTMSGWGSIGVPYLGVLNAADTFQYLSGSYQPELSCDTCMVGGYWGYKARNLDRFVLPLCHPSSGLSVKLFGNRQWPVHQYLGGISVEDERDLYASATVCVNVSEPHSTDEGLGWDLIERPFKIASSGGFCVSDYVAEGRDLFTEAELPMGKTPAEFADLVRHFVVHPEEREPFRRRMRAKVLRGHTYFERVAAILGGVGMTQERDRCLAIKQKTLGHLLEEPS